MKQILLRIATVYCPGNPGKMPVSAFCLPKVYPLESAAGQALLSKTIICQLQLLSSMRSSALTRQLIPENTNPLINET